MHRPTARPKRRLATFRDSQVSLRRTLIRAFERLTNTRVYSVLPRGVDEAWDLARSLPRLRVRIVFDVGANVGKSARRYLKVFPESRIFCFEPVEPTFRKLQRNSHGKPRIQQFQIALGSCKGMAQMVAHEQSEWSHLVTGADAESVDGATGLINVVVDTVDGFCRDQAIERIGFLKIDTEGADLDVLKGADAMLSNQKIDVVQVEAGMNRGNQRHVPIELLKDFLECKRYVLFGIYEQVHEWPTGEPQLRRTNLVFISETVIKAHVRPAAA